MPTWEGTDRQVDSSGARAPAHRAPHSTPGAAREGWCHPKDRWTDEEGGQHRNSTKTTNRRWVRIKLGELLIRRRGEKIKKAHRRPEPGPGLDRNRAFSEGGAEPEVSRLAESESDFWIYRLMFDMFGVFSSFLNATWASTPLPSGHWTHRGCARTHTQARLTARARPESGFLPADVVTRRL